MTRMAIIDFEASCLPEDHFSYPIQVSLTTLEGPSRSWLIKPSAKWQFWDWCDEAEALHGISREQLRREGLPVGQVLAELAAQAAGYTVYARSDLDAYWLETLAEAANRPVPFPIRYLGDLFAQGGIERQNLLIALETARMAGHYRYPAAA